MNFTSRFLPSIFLLTIGVFAAAASRHASGHVSLLILAVSFGAAAWIARSGWIRSAAAQDHTFEKTHVSPLEQRPRQVSLWDGIPVGVAHGGRLVAFSPVDVSILVAGEPRSGKSVFLANLLLSAALDPHVRVVLFDGKAGNDHTVWAPVLDVYDREGDPLTLLRYLQETYRDLRRRYDEMAARGLIRLTREACESGMPMKIIFIDELSRYTVTYPNTKVGKEIVHLLSLIASQGPAAGVLLVMATQRADVNVVPGILRDNASVRAAFRLHDATSSDIVLGRGMARRGFDASTIARIDQRGVGILDADGEDPRRFKTFLVSAEASDLEAALRLARELRARAGTLPVRVPAEQRDPDDAPSEAPAAADGPDIVADALAVFEPNETAVHSGTLLERLRVADPTTYGDWSPQRFGKALAACGIRSRQTRIGGVNGAAYRRDQLEVDGDTTLLSSDELRSRREDDAVAILSPEERRAYELRVAEIQAARECAYCMEPFTPDNPGQVDHLIPLAEGGTSHAWNLVPACRRCNAAKRDRPAQEFIVRLRQRQLQR